MRHVLLMEEETRNLYEPQTSLFEEQSVVLHALVIQNLNVLK